MERHRPFAIVLARTTVILQMLVLAVGSDVDVIRADAPDAERVREIAGWLASTPRGAGPTIEDRKIWGKIAAMGDFEGVVPRADALLKEPMPDLSDELFLDFSKTGNRRRCEVILAARRSRLSSLVLAECLENRGRFVPDIERTIRELCGEKTWVMPAHDRALKNFRGEIVEIDLAVAGLSWNLATAYHWLGNRLSPDTRHLVRDELERRTLRPFEGMVTKGTPATWWLRGTNNWNAVCLAGVTGTAMAMIDSAERRAFFAASAEKYVEYFLSGFTADGYCSEGVGYWNYGFGHYVLLGETLHQATNGRVDLFKRPLIREIALFGRRMEIAEGMFPAFADCSVGSRPDTRLMAFLSRKYSLGLAQIEKDGLLLAQGPSGQLFSLGLYGFENSATAVPTAEPSAKPVPRDWFSAANVLICRPTSDERNSLAVALKGGHNAEHHNHNDVGSYLVCLGGKAPLIDPGAEVYTARTFSSKRYDSGVLNSFGHPVPRIAGKLQRTGRSAAAQVLKTDFQNDADTITLDLRAAYDVPELKELQRTFVYSRLGKGTFTVTDDVVFETPQAFGTALITFEPWQQVSEDRFVIGEGGSAVLVEIDAPAFSVEPVEIQEDVRGGRLPTRLGIELEAPVTQATVRITIKPANR